MTADEALRRNPDDLTARLRAGLLDAERVALAAALGHEGALATGIPPSTPGLGPCREEDLAKGRMVALFRALSRDPASVMWRNTLDAATWRLWACDCAERAMEHGRIVREPLPVSLEAVRVARLFAVGEATEDELNSAHAAALRPVRFRGVHVNAHWEGAFAAFSATDGQARSGASQAAQSARSAARLAAQGGEVAEKDWQCDALARRILGLR